MPCKPGVCQECGAEHHVEQPHDKDSVYYQYKFYDENGRWPTWEDAMAHCTEEMKVEWIKVAAEMGVKIIIK